MASSVFLGLGTNKGDREVLLNKVLELITGSVGPVAACSGIYVTEPWGFESRDNFLNMVIQVYTDLKPFDLLEKLSIIENQLGRKRSSGKYISRTIDIDILIYGNRVIDSPDLKIPHPLIQARKFVLIPFCDIAPELTHPVLDKTFAELLKECRDDRKVKKIYPPPFSPRGGKEIQST
jgi:2-amino-4-hydroxy-6-hydroxymethyldihydropteridine diphosphokinase